MNWKRIALWGGIGFVVLNCVGCLLLSVLLPESENGETVAEVEVTTTPEPTEEPTDVPTEEPATSEPEVDPETAAYAREVIQNTTLLYAGLLQIDELLQAPKLEDGEWKSTLVLKFVGVQLIYDELSDLNPPPTMEEMHTSLLSITQGCLDATVVITEAVDSQNNDELRRGSTLLENCDNDLEDTTQMIVEAQST